MFFIFFTKIENNIVEGRVLIGGIANMGSVCREMSCETTYSDELGYFSGSLKNGVAECEFNCGEDIVKMVLRFDENFIEARRMRLDGGYLYGTYRYEPYNLEDIGTSSLKSVQSSQVEVDLFGKINLTTAAMEISGDFGGLVESYALVFLTDEKNNIVCGFGGDYWCDLGDFSASEIVDTTIEDVNGDGLDDITFFTIPFFDEREAYGTLTYLQVKDGFCQVLDYYQGDKSDICGVEVDARDTILGKWVVTRKVATRKDCDLSEEEIDSYIGKQIEYSEYIASFEEKTCYEMEYNAGMVSKDGFARYNEPVNFDTIGYKGNELERIRVVRGFYSHFCWGNVGAIVYVKDNDTLLSNWRGVFFELKRVP